MGDEVIEQLFILANDIGKNIISVTIAPTDPRLNQLIPISALPWTAELYTEIADPFSLYLRKSVRKNALVRYTDCQLNSNT